MTAADFVIADGTIRLWPAALDIDTPALTTLSSTLSPDERARAARFIFERDRLRFAAARGWLRTILGRCVGVHPAALRFEYSSTGKPSLSWAGREAVVHFNLAHSEDRALVAVTRLGAVGVDVERVRDIEHAPRLVERFFSPRESALFQALPADRQPAAFFNLWTRKEALLKATGEGLSASLRQVEVSFLPGEAARLLAVAGDEEEAAHWTLRELAPAANFVGAVAVRAAHVGVTVSDVLTRPDVG